MWWEPSTEVPLRYHEGVALWAEAWVIVASHDMLSVIPTPASHRNKFSRMKPTISSPTKGLNVPVSRPSSPSSVPSQACEPRCDTPPPVPLSPQTQVRREGCSLTKSCPPGLTHRPASDCRNQQVLRRLCPAWGTGKLRGPPELGSL